jgi:hypothetical protein
MCEIKFQHSQVNSHFGNWNLAASFGKKKKNLFQAEPFLEHWKALEK